MFNMNDIKNDIITQLKTYAAKRYNVKKEEVDIKFKRDGNIDIFIKTSSYFDDLNCKVTITETKERKSRYESKD